MSNQAVSITEADVAAFAHRLAEWAEAQSPIDQTILIATLSRAAGETHDVSGYDHGARPDFFAFGVAGARFLHFFGGSSDDRPRGDRP
jgi:hypothetical protein